VLAITGTRSLANGTRYLRDGAFRQMRYHVIVDYQPVEPFVCGLALVLRPDRKLNLGVDQGRETRFPFRRRSCFHSQIRDPLAAQMGVRFTVAFCYQNFRVEP
jgi:hypothetical protein